MVKRYLFDTDVCIDYLRGQPKAVAFFDKLDDQACFISTITTAELFVGIKNDAEGKILEHFFNYFNILPVDQDIAKLGGHYRRQYKGSHNTGIMDALIAATAHVHELTLISLNTKHFPMISHKKTPYRKT